MPSDAKSNLVQAVKATAARPRSTTEQADRDLKEYVRLRDKVRSEPTAYTSEDGDALSDLQARIVVRYTKLIESIARRFRGANEPFEDLVQEGYLGLLSALDHFDPEKKVLFPTYATHFVAGAMRHCLRDRGKIIKEPAWLSDLSRKIERVSESLTQSLGRTPLFTEIAATLETTEDLVVECLASRPIFRTATFGISPDDSEDRISDAVIAFDATLSNSNSGHENWIQDRILLEDTVVKLKDLEKDVLLDFFYKGLNQSEIAKRHGISGNYAGQILKNATGKLRKLLEESEIREQRRDPRGSFIDSQTGLFTADYLMSRCDESISRAARASQSLAVIVLQFSGVAAKSGTSLNACWESCGAAIREAIRRVDSAGRLADNSFFVVLPGIGEEATKAAKKLEDVLTEAVTVSGTRAGVEARAAVFPDHGRSARELVSHARAGLQIDLLSAENMGKGCGGGSIAPIQPTIVLPATEPLDKAPANALDVSARQRSERLPRSRSEVRASKLLARQPK